MSSFQRFFSYLAIVGTTVFTLYVVDNLTVLWILLITLFGIIILFSTE